MQVPVNVSLPLLGIGIFTLLLSLVFCCYMWRLKRKAKKEQGYKKIIFSSQKKKKLPNDTCPVCLDEFRIKEQIVICPCQHVFHVRCLTEWLRHKNSCPMCKAPVQPISGEQIGLAGETTGLIRPASAASNV